jgi:hypothetical protein
MQRYKNLSGDSGVISYEIGKDFIKVQFADGSIYLYNYSSPGEDEVEVMKTLATSGSGLTTFINKYVRGNYAGKLSS